MSTNVIDAAVDHRNAASEAEARRFLAALYADPDTAEVNDADWTGAADSRLVALREQAASGDEALQSLMLNFVLHNAQDGAQAKRLSTVIAGIKMALVSEIMHEFPTASMEELVASAKAAGYDVEVLG